MPNAFEYKYDVFMSFTGGDRELKNNIAARLDADGYEVYDSDTYCKGHFREDYVEALCQSRIYLLILSDNLRNDPAVSGRGSFSECRKELSTALELDSYNRLNIVTLCTSDFFRFHGGLYDFHDRIGKFYYSNTRSLSMVFDRPDENGFVSDKAYHDIESRVRSFIDERNNGTPVPSQTQKLKLAAENLPNSGVFIGRESEITDAIQAFENGSNVVILSGMGGIGKTVLATEIARLCNEQSGLKYMQTVRIPELNNTSGLLNSLVSFAGYTAEVYDTLYRLNERDQQEIKLRALTELPDYTLLVVDNYNNLREKDLADITEKLNCRVILTTRSKINSPSNKATTINVKYMNRVQALELFKSYCKEVTADDFDRLYEYTGGHTQTLCIIAKMMTLHKMSADMILGKMNGMGSAAAKVEFWHNDYSLDGTITDHLTKLFDISAFDENKLNLLRQMTLLSDGSISVKDFMNALKLETRNEIIDLSRSGWLEIIEKAEEEILYIHPIISHLMAERLLPDNLNCAAIIAYLLDETQRKKRAMTYSDARSLCERLYYALHTLACSCKTINHALFDAFSEINNILGGDDAKKRLSDLLKITMNEADTALISAYYDTLVIHENPTRVDIFDKYITNIEKNSNNYKWVLGTLSVILPYVELNATYKKKLASILDAAADAAIYRKDDLALSMLLSFMVKIGSETIPTAKKIHRYVKSIKGGHQDGNAILLKISDANVIGSGLLKHSDSDHAIEKQLKLIEDASEISGFFEMIGFALKHPWIAITSVKNGSLIYNVSDNDPMKKYFESLLSASETLIESGKIDVKSYIFAAVELHKKLTERGFSMQSAEQTVMGVLAIFSNLNLPKETVLGESEMLTEGIDMENPSLNQLSTLQISAVINSQFGNGEKAMLQRKAIMETLRRVRPMDHIDVVNAAISFADACIALGKYDEAIALYTNLYSQFADDQNKINQLSIVSRKLVDATQRLIWSSASPAEITKTISCELLKKHFNDGTSSLGDDNFEYYKALYDYTIILAAKWLNDGESAPDYQDTDTALKEIYSIIASVAKNHKQYSSAILNQIIFTAESSLYYVRHKNPSLALTVAESLRPLAEHKGISVKNNAKRVYITTASFVALNNTTDTKQRLAIHRKAITDYVALAGTLKQSCSSVCDMFALISKDSEYLTDRKLFISAFSSKKGCKAKINALIDEVYQTVILTADYPDESKAVRMRNFITNKTFALIANHLKQTNFRITDKKYRKMKSASDFILAVFTFIKEDVQARPWLTDEGCFNKINSSCYYFYEGETNPEKKPHGNGIYFHAATGKTISEGYWQNGMLNGFGKHYADGSIYEGEWSDNKRHGIGKLTYATGGVYEGEWYHGIRQGQGTLKFSAGGVYEGEWFNDQRHGMGKHVFADGSIYEGEWQNGMRHGMGKHTYADGGVYEGEWQLDKRHGSGEHRYSTGGIDNGQWQNGRLHGFASSVYPDGCRYEGEWQNGLRHGNGKYTYASGNYYDGGWKLGNRHGFGRFVYREGGYSEGTWKNAATCVDGRIVFTDGVVYEGSFTNGKLFGFCRLNYADGEVYEGEFAEHNPVGEGKLTYADGSFCVGEFTKTDGRLYADNVTLIAADGSNTAGRVEKNVFIPAE